MKKNKIQMGLLLAGILLFAGAGRMTYAAEVQTEQHAVLQEEGTAAEWNEASEETDISNFETSGTDEALTITKYKGSSQIVNVKKLFEGKTVVAIGWSAFKDNESIQKVILPDTVTSIEHTVFAGCKSLTSVSGTQKVEQIGEYAFSGCEKLSSIDISGATTIETEAFRTCKSLKRIAIPEGTKSIAEGIFYSAGLLEVSLPSTLEEIGKNAFRETGLQAVSIPDRCETIADGAFMGCTSLAKVTFGEKSELKSIGASFNYCESLSSIVIPAKCTNIGGSAFLNAYGLEEIEFRNKDTVIGKDAFYGANDLTVYAEPDGKVQSYMEENYAGSTHYRFNRYTDTLTVKGLPKTEYFYGENFDTDGLVVEADFTSDTDPATDIVDLSACKISKFSKNKVGKQTITIRYGKAKTSYDVYVYYNIANARAASVDSQIYTGVPVNPVFQITGEETGNVLSNEKQYTVSYKGNHTDAGKVTATITGMGSYRGEKEITFYITKKDIGDADIIAEPITVEYTGKEQKPEPKLSYGGIALKNTDFSDVSYQNNTEIGTAYYTVSGIGNYTGSVTGEFEITAPIGKVITVGNYRYKVTSDDTAEFAGLVKANTKKVTVEKKVVIGGRDFEITSVGAKALSKNKKVTSVVIGNQVKSIGKSAFESCKNLKTVTIGTGVTKIEAKAFKGCGKLQTVTIRSKQLKSIGKEGFKGTKPNATIKVPAKKMASYKKMLKKSGVSSKAKIKKG